MASSDFGIKTKARIPFWGLFENRTVILRPLLISPARKLGSPFSCTWFSMYSYFIKHPPVAWAIAQLQGAQKAAKTWRSLHFESGVKIELSDFGIKPKFRIPRMYFLSNITVILRPSLARSARGWERRYAPYDRKGWSPLRRKTTKKIKTDKNCQRQQCKRNPKKPKPYQDVKIVAHVGAWHHTEEMLRLYVSPKDRPKKRVSRKMKIKWRNARFPAQKKTFTFDLIYFISEIQNTQWI